jgi:parallel beta-helix repeat protein
MISEGPRVLVRDGEFFLAEPLVLKPEDSGITVASDGNERPVLSGGRAIRLWNEIQIAGKKLWSAEIPDVREGKWFFRELWVNGTRATRARHPNKGYLHIEALPDSTPEWTIGHTRFRFHEGDLQAWASITNAEVVAMTRWVESRLPIVEVDAKERTVSFSRKSVFQLAPDDPYYVENAFEFLDEPGEWYLDTGAGRVYYLPRPGEGLNSIEAIAPRLSQVLRIERSSTNAEQFVRKATFRGVTFSHAEWDFPPGFHGGTGKLNKRPETTEPGGFAQAAVGVPGAVWAEGARDCVFDHCAFSQIGAYGLELGAACASNRIVHCEFSDLGAGGIKIGGPITAKTQEQTRANEISDCHLHDGGKLFASAVGVWIGQSPDNVIIHNHIHDFFYTGISVGWTWGYGATAATNNQVSFNHVHHIGIKSDGDGPILSDMGGIYTLGMQPGTRIINNEWHDVAGLRYGGWGIYLDEGSSSILVVSNVVFRTTHGGFHQHYGATNVIRNNIFAFARDHQVQRTRPEPHASFYFQTNVVYFDNGVLLGGDWGGDRYEMDWNDYFDARTDSSPASMLFAGETLEKWRERGHDSNSIVADPMFLDPGKGDFRFRSSSPPRRLGFQPIQTVNVGPRPLSSLR